MDANTSRVGLSVVNPEGVKVVVEFDFSNSASLDPRLRHAYGEYNNVRIGRYWLKAIRSSQQALATKYRTKPTDLSTWPARP